MSELVEELRHHEAEYSSLIHGPLCGQAADEIDRLRRRVTVLEMVIRQDLHPSDCSDELNEMVAQDIHDRFSTGAPAHSPAENLSQTVERGTPKG